METYYERNKEKMKARAREYQRNKWAGVPIEEKRRIVREQVRLWREENKERNRATQRKAHKEYSIRKKFSPQHRVREKVGKALQSIFNFKAGGKRRNVPFVLHATAMSREEVKSHFDIKEGYSIDHIIPLCAFDLTDPIQLLKANHISNLRYVTLTENCEKGQKIPDFDMASLPYNDNPAAIAHATLFIQPVLDYVKHHGK